MTHYVTSEQQGPVIPPLFLRVWSWKLLPKSRCVLQLEGSRVTALFYRLAFDPRPTWLRPNQVLAAASGELSAWTPWPVVGPDASGQQCE